jgi:flagella basal body P-ring formation protein FlgA
MQRKDCEKLRRIAFSIAGIGVMLSAAQAQAATLSVWREAVVDAEEVRVADVCRIADATDDEQVLIGDAVIAAAPVPGGSLVVSANEVRRVLRDRGVNLANIVLKGAATCAVTRPRKVAPAQVEVPPASEPANGEHVAASAPRCLRQIVEDYFAQEYSGGGRVLVRFGRANEEALDLCEPRFGFRIQRTSGAALGMVGLKVTVFERGDEVRTFPLLVDVARVAPVVVAARPINLGAIVGADDLRVVEMSVSRGDQPAASEPQAVIGQRARQFIAEGEPVRTRDLEAVPLVKRGQLVDVASNVGGVSIMTAAQATSDGAYGDVVTLRADKGSRQHVTAIVTGPGRVRIGGGDEILAMGGEQ